MADRTVLDEDEGNLSCSFNMLLFNVLLFMCIY